MRVIFRLWFHAIIYFRDHPIENNEAEARRSDKKSMEEISLKYPKFFREPQNHRNGNIASSRNATIQHATSVQLEALGDNRS